MTTKFTEQSGFTLIEALMAMVIFAVGILALYAMLIAAIGKNVTANRITTASNWSQDKVEEVIGTRHVDLVEGATTKNGCAGLGDWPNSDGSIPEENQYTIYWNVAGDCTLTEVPDAKDAVQEQKPKHVRVIVTQKILGIEKEFAVFNYIKQNTQ